MGGDSHSPSVWAQQRCCRQEGRERRAAPNRPLLLLAECLHGRPATTVSLQPRGMWSYLRWSVSFLWDPAKPNSPLSAFGIYETSPCLGGAQDQANTRSGASRYKLALAPMSPSSLCSLHHPQLSSSQDAGYALGPYWAIKSGRWRRWEEKSLRVCAMYTCVSIKCLAEANT